MADSVRPAPRLFSRGSWAESSRIADILRKETLGGALLLVATLLALGMGELPLVRGLRVPAALDVRPRSAAPAADPAQWAG